MQTKGSFRLGKQTNILNKLTTVTVQQSINSFKLLPCGRRRLFIKTVRNWLARTDLINKDNNKNSALIR